MRLRLYSSLVTGNVDSTYYKTCGYSLLKNKCDKCDHFFLMRWDWVHLVLRPLLAYCTSARWYMMMIVEQLVECELAWETEVLGENKVTHFVHHKSHMTKNIRFMEHVILFRFSYLCLPWTDTARRFSFSTERNHSFPKTKYSQCGRKIRYQYHLHELDLKANDNND
jgi:hypothetical protein